MDSSVKEEAVDLSVKEETVDSSVKEETMDSKKDGKNPYAYLNRNEFTSEKFKIEVSGLPRNYGFSVCLSFPYFD